MCDSLWKNFERNWVPPPPSSASPGIAWWSGSALRGHRESRAAKLSVCLSAWRKQQNTNHQLCFMNIFIYNAGVEFFKKGVQHLYWICHSSSNVDFCFINDLAFLFFSFFPFYKVTVNVRRCKPHTYIVWGLAWMLEGKKFVW